VSDWREALRARRVGETDGLVMWHVEPGLYVQEVSGHLTADGMERSLRQVWGRDDFVTPYGVVHVMHPDTTYDNDIRDFPDRPNIVPAVASAVVTDNRLHRMVLSALGIASRLKRGTRVSAHSGVVEAVEHVRGLLRSGPRPTAR
jgi:hypothetical protein